MTPRSRARMLFALLGMAAVPAAAVILPMRIGFQGKLLDPATNLPKNGTVSMTFNIYNVPSGGASLYTEGPVTVPVVNGVFAVQIGTSALLSADLFAGASAYLGITVSPDAEMTPRQPLSMSPYAFTAMQLVSHRDIRVNPGVAYSTFTSDGNLLVPKGISVATGAFSAQGAAVYSVFTSSGLFMSSGTLRLGADSRGLDATGTGVVASTGQFRGVGNSVFSIVTSSGVNVGGGTLLVSATGGISTPFGVVASTGFFRGTGNSIYSIVTSSGINVTGGTLLVSATGGISTPFGVVASTGRFTAGVNGLFGVEISSGLRIASGTFAMNGAGGINARYGVKASSYVGNASSMSFVGPEVSQSSGSATVNLVAGTEVVAISTAISLGHANQKVLFLGMLQINRVANAVATCTIRCRVNTAGACTTGSTLFYSYTFTMNNTASTSYAQPVIALHAPLTTASASYCLNVVCDQAHSLTTRSLAVTLTAP